jgi:small GTP-binding protein
MGNVAALFGEQRKEARILLVGLDKAGKTTVLYRLKQNTIIPTVSTAGFNMEVIEFRNTQMLMWDVGGGYNSRPYWHCYLQNVDAIVYVVDSADRDRLEEARDELERFLRNDIQKEVLLLIFANKQDLPQSMREMEIVKLLKLEKLDRHWMVQLCSTYTGEGLFEGLDWIVHHLNYN